MDTREQWKSIGLDEETFPPCKELAKEIAMTYHGKEMTFMQVLTSLALSAGALIHSSVPVEEQEARVQLAEMLKTLTETSMSAFVLSQKSEGSMH
jgi:hypothetical protein